MRKCLLEKPAAEQIISRVKSLQMESRNKWGEMNATEMLYHCNLANLQILEGSIPFQKTKPKQFILRMLSLYLVPEFLKNLKRNEENDTKGRINMDQFETEKLKFIRIIHRFVNHKSPINLTHPAFGNLNTRQWGIAAWKHMDHHLRQFGV